MAAWLKSVAALCLFMSHNVPSVHATRRRGPCTEAHEIAQVFEGLWATCSTGASPRMSSFPCRNSKHPFLWAGLSSERHTGWTLIAISLRHSGGQATFKCEKCFPLAGHVFTRSFSLEMKARLSQEAVVSSPKHILMLVAFWHDYNNKTK